MLQHRAGAAAMAASTETTRFDLLQSVWTQYAQSLIPEPELILRDAQFHSFQVGNGCIVTNVSDN